MSYDSMTEKSSFFCTQSTDDVSPLPTASRGRRSLTGAKCQRPVAERRCSRARTAAACGICLETVSDQGLLLRRLSSGMLVESCPHQYCFTCVLMWADRTNTCPMCKERFNAVRRKPAEKLRGVGETIEVEHKDPPADAPSDDEDVAAALALAEGEHASGTVNNQDSNEEGEEDADPWRRRGAHGYEIDDFVVSEGSCEEEEDEEEEWDEDEEWQQSPDVEILDENTPSAGRNRRWTRALARDSVRRISAGAVTSPDPMPRGRRRTRQSVLPWRRGAVLATGRQEGARREGRGNSSRVDSRGTEDVVGSAELRQLQQEAARVLGNSPLRRRRGLPRLPARSQHPRPVISVDAITSDDDSDFSSPRHGWNSLGDESPSANDRERARRGGDSHAGASLTSRKSADGSRGSSTAYSIEDDTDDGVVNRTGSDTMTAKEANEEEEEEDENEDWVPLRDRIVARRRIGGRRRSSPSTAVSMRSSPASSERPVHPRIGDAAGSGKPPTAAGLRRGGSVNERLIPSLGDARQSAAEPTWSPWLSARRGSSNSEHPLRRSFGRAPIGVRSGIQGLSNRGTRRGSSNSEQLVGGSFGRTSCAVRGGLCDLSNRGSALRNVDAAAVATRRTAPGCPTGQDDGEKEDWGVGHDQSQLRHSRRGRFVIEKDDKEEEFDWGVGDALSVAEKDDRGRGNETGKKRGREGSSSDNHGASRALPRRRETNQSRIRGCFLRRSDGGSPVSDGSSGGGRRCEKTSEGIKYDSGSSDAAEDAFLSLGSEDEGCEDGAVTEKGKGTKRPRPRGMCDPSECLSRGRGRRRTPSAMSPPATIEGFLNQFRFNGSSV